MKFSIRNEPLIVGILFALPIEQHRFASRLTEWERLESSGVRYDVGELNGTQCVCLVSGPGMSNAKQGVEQMLLDWKIDFIISAGFSGALVDDLKIGDLIVGTSVSLEENGETLTFDSSDLLSEKRHDAITTATQVVATADQKTHLHHKTHAVAVDMESFAVLEAASKAEVSGLVLRSISDELNHEIPQEIINLLDEHGRPRIGKLFFSVIKRPSFIFDLKRMVRRADKASTSLADGLVEMIENLA